MHILFLNPQGNFDAQDRYWTEHPDFGGQLVYVKEIACAMSELGHTVDIVTRRIQDESITGFEKKMDGYQGYPNTRIIRIPSGPKTFLEKENLWPFIEEWVLGIKSFYKIEKKSVDFITTHYADGGLAGVMLSKLLKVPYSFTGHSLGAQKMDKLDFDHQNQIQLNDRFKFSNRLYAERLTIQYASIIFTSTPQEKEEQYMHKAYKDVSTQQLDKFVVAPPGVNEKVFGNNVVNDIEVQTYEHIEQTLKRDFNKDRLDLPSVVLASRLDQKKNHMAVLKAFAKSRELQETMNIVISVRGLDNAFNDFSQLKNEEFELMKQFMEIIETNHLKGKISFINITSQKALAAMYRYFSKHRGAFSLTSTYEPFGLAPIEAMCAGLPVAVTKYGGPADVLEDENGSYGVLLDVMDEDHIIKGFLQLFKHYDFYKTQGIMRVETSYTWKSTALKYIESIQNVLDKTFEIPNEIATSLPSKSDHIDFLKTYYL
jgi:sucrose-phosphate synthase